MEEIYEMLRKAGVIENTAFHHLSTRERDVWLEVEAYIEKAKENAYNDGWDECDKGHGD
jgi:hypothetical protein